MVLGTCGVRVTGRRWGRTPRAHRSACGLPGCSGRVCVGRCFPGDPAGVAQMLFLGVLGPKSTTPPGLLANKQGPAGWRVPWAGPEAPTVTATPSLPPDSTLPYGSYGWFTGPGLVESDAYQSKTAQPKTWCGVMRRRATKHLQKPFSELVLQEERTEAVGQTGQRVQEERTF